MRGLPLQELLEFVWTHLLDWTHGQQSCSRIDNDLLVSLSGLGSEHWFEEGSLWLLIFCSSSEFAAQRSLELKLRLWTA